MSRRPTNRQRKLTPLAYMLQIINDPTADPNRRDTLARCAAQYVHSKAGEKGKKDATAAAARKAGGRGTEWDGDLQFSDGRSRE
jgi:hypothetical protein